MASSSSRGAQRDVSRSPLTTFVEISWTNKFEKGNKISLLSTSEFLKRVVKVDNASSQQMADVLRTKMQDRERNSFAATFAITDPSLACQSARF